MIILLCRTARQLRFKKRSKQQNSITINPTKDDRQMAIGDAQNWKYELRMYVGWWLVRMCYVCVCVGIGRLFFVTVLVTPIAADRCRALLCGRRTRTRVAGGRRTRARRVATTQYARRTSFNIIITYNINYGMHVAVAQCTTHNIGMNMDKHERISCDMHNIPDIIPKPVFI